MNRTRRYFPEYRITYNDSMESFPTRETAWSRFSCLMLCEVRNLVVWGCPFGSAPVRIWSDVQEHKRRDAQAYAALLAWVDREIDRERAGYTRDLDDVDLAEISAEARANCY